MLVAAAVLVYALDRLTKVIVLATQTPGTTTPLLGPVLQIHFVENPGAAFSLGSGSTWVFAVIAIAVATFIVVFARRIRSPWWALLFGMLLGGTLGNLTDRLTRGATFGSGTVVDFVQLILFPAIFNIADVAIVVAMGLFILLTARGVRLDGLRVRRTPAVAEGPDEQTDAAASTPSERTPSDRPDAPADAGPDPAKPGV